MKARWSGLLGVVLASATTLTASLPVRAQSALPATAEERKLAAKDFAEGDRAFKEGDYRQAAESYERAYQRVPHHSALWNAARAWHRAGELAKAANLYARYLREAPPNARDRNSAQRAMNELSNKLARLEIHATDVGDVHLDGQAVQGASVCVTPGAHGVEGRAPDGREVRQEPKVDAGDVVSVALVPPAATPQPPAPPPPPEPEHASRSRGWSPVVVYFEGAVTLALTGITIWSGFDTLSQKDTFDRTPTQDNLDAGRQKESRTNVLILGSAGLAALTAATAIFLVDWRGGGSKEDASPHVQVGAGPGVLTLRGEF